VISPPMLQLEPGARQLVRVVRIGPPPAGPGEDAYRVVIDELPISTEPRKGLNFVMRYSVPVFVAPRDAMAEPKLNWSVQQKDGKVMLEVANAGGRHAQLSSLNFVRPDGTRMDMHRGLLGYVLPMARMRWMLQMPSAVLAAGGTIEAQVNGEK